MCNRKQYQMQARLIFVLFLMCGSHSIASQQVDFDYYDIHASNGRELLAQISSNAPSGYAGFTQWNISYEFSTSQRSGDCQLLSTDLSLSIRYQLPRWVNESDANWAVKERWGSWYPSLLEHEEEHGSHAIAAYESIRDQFNGITSEPTCDDLGSKLADIVNQLTTEYRLADKELDEITQHGGTQGAALENLLEERYRTPDLGAAMEADDNAPLQKWLKIFGGLILLYWGKRKVFG